MISAEELEQTIRDFCKLRKITPEQFLNFLDEVCRENIDNAENITMSEIIDLIEQKIKNNKEIKNERI